jgi:methyltransferase
LLDAGGRLVKDDGYGLLVVTHSLFFAAAVVEAWFAPWAGIGPSTSWGLALLIVGEGLRGWSMFTLGSRWTTRVVILPTSPLVAGGPYRWIRHPIYVGVTLMIVGFPLAFGLWMTLGLAATLNGIALVRRIRREDLALASVAPG